MPTAPPRWYLGFSKNGAQQYLTVLTTLKQSRVFLSPEELSDPTQPLRPAQESLSPTCSPAKRGGTSPCGEGRRQRSCCCEQQKLGKGDAEATEAHLECCVRIKVQR